MKCLFCGFLNKKKNHKNGFPFFPIFETNNTISFLSVPENKKQENHILVIPKEHYEFFDEIPKKILNELIFHVSLASKILKEEFPGYRIQLNNGRDAEQYIPHVHFHIFPMKNKKEYPLLKDKSFSEFTKLTKILRKKFKKEVQE